MRRRYLLILLLNFLLISFCAMAFSQEELKVSPYIPLSPEQEKYNFERRIDMEKGIIKSCGFFGNLLQYVALRQDNLSVCPDANCRKGVEEELLFLRYEAEGKCNKIKNLAHKNICEALKSNNCNQLTNNREKEYCNGLINGNIDNIVKVTMKETRREEAEAKAETLHNFGIYWGFKYFNSATACEKYINQIGINNKSIVLFRQLACQILFYPDVDQAIDNILRDLAIFSLSRQDNNKGLCNDIRNKKIKDACLSPYFKDLSAIFR